MHTIEEIITIHNSTYVSLLHCLAKGREIDFLQSSLINIRTGVMTTPLLIVATKMLDGCHHSPALNALYVLTGYLRSEIGILAEIFIITTAQG